MNWILGGANWFLSNTFICLLTHISFSEYCCSKIVIVRNNHEANEIWKLFFVKFFFDKTQSCNYLVQKSFGSKFWITCNKKIYILFRKSPQKYFICWIFGRIINDFIPEQWFSFDLFIICINWPKIDVLEWDKKDLFHLFFECFDFWLTYFFSQSSQLSYISCPHWHLISISMFSFPRHSLVIVYPIMILNSDWKNLFLLCDVMHATLAVATLTVRQTLTLQGNSTNFTSVN